MDWDYAACKKTRLHGNWYMTHSEGRPHGSFFQQASDKRIQRERTHIILVIKKRGYWKYRVQETYADRWKGDTTIGWGNQLDDGSRHWKKTVLSRKTSLACEKSRECQASRVSEATRELLEKRRNMKRDNNGNVEQIILCRIWRLKDDHSRRRHVAMLKGSKTRRNIGEKLLKPMGTNFGRLSRQV